MKHNNVLPNAHFRKHWQLRVKTWFDQPSRKKARQNARITRASKIAPRPLGKLRPSVHCPTIRYNRRLRLGRGFSLDELSAVKMSRKYARTIGIAVDHRRKNKSEESLKRNVDRLHAYLSKLRIFKTKRAFKAARKIGNKLENQPQKKADRFHERVNINHIQPIAKKNKVGKSTVKVVSRAILPGEHKFKAFATLRKARVLARYHDSRVLRAKATAELAAQKK